MSLQFDLLTITPMENTLYQWGRAGIFDSEKSIYMKVSPGQLEWFYTFQNHNPTWEIKKILPIEFVHDGTFISDFFQSFVFQNGMVWFWVARIPSVMQAFDDFVHQKKRS